MELTKADNFMYRCEGATCFAFMRWMRLFSLEKCYRAQIANLIRDLQQLENENRPVRGRGGSLLKLFPCLMTER
jgi:hypothetical protein